MLDAELPSWRFRPGRELAVPKYLAYIATVLGCCLEVWPLCPLWGPDPGNRKGVGICLANLRLDDYVLSNT